MEIIRLYCCNAKWQSIYWIYSQTWFIYSSEWMSRIMFTGPEAAVAKVKVITAPTLKPGAIYREHLASVTSKESVETVFLFSWFICLLSRGDFHLYSMYLTPGCTLGTSSISDRSPVQCDCWGKSTITSFPLALKAGQKLYIKPNNNSFHVYLKRKPCAIGLRNIAKHKSIVQQKLKNTWTWRQAVIYKVKHLFKAV